MDIEDLIETIKYSDIDKIKLMAEDEESNKFYITLEQIFRIYRDYKSFF